MRDKHITAEIIADSITKEGKRLTSFIVVVPRIVLAEFNTHRMLSRNSASSRAIPFETMLQKVIDTPFIPIKWQKDHKGMQGNQYLTGRDIDLADGAWLRARDHVVKEAKMLNRNIGVTKQFCNRLLEAYLYHTIIATASEWQNFFALRAHSAAEIHIQNLAFKMLAEYNKSTPKKLEPGQWHIPFGDRMDQGRIEKLTGYVFDSAENGGVESNEVYKLHQEAMVKIATARCARVSYQNYEGGDDYAKDIALHDRLSSMGHWSPFEHCARAMTSDEYVKNVRGEKYWYDADSDPLAGHFDNSGYQDSKDIQGWSGNFKGFIQYRKTFQGENKKDSRVIEIKL